MKKFARLQNLIFDYDEEKKRKIKDESLDLGAYKFLSSRIYSATQKSSFSKQVVIKLLSNLSAKGVKNALNYVIRNSDSEFALNQDGERICLNEIMRDWSRDFSSKENAKEAWHFTFSLDEDVSERNLEILQKSVNEVMQKNFCEYKYVSVIHSHQNKPHIHIILNKNNIFTCKKLHFKSKGEVKDFWNLLREDFKNSLLFHNPHLNYTNKYKFERDLLKTSAQIDTQLNINQEITKSIQSANNKILFYEKNIDLLKEKIAKLSQDKNALIQILKEYMSSQNKRSFQTLKAIKALNLELNALKDSASKYTQDISRLKTQIKELNFERLSYKNEYANLAKKQAFLRFLESKAPAFIHSKSDILLKTKIKSDLALNAHNLAQNFEQNIQIDLLLSKSLNKKTNAFSMISLVRDLDSHLMAISKLNVSAELSERLQGYEHILKANRRFILELCEQKLQNLNKAPLKGEKSAFRQKELNALQIFLNKPQSVISSESLAKVSAPLKESINPAHSKQTPKSSSALDGLNVDGFLQWYCKKQDIRNVSLYEARLREQIKSGSFENFKQLYKEFEWDKNKGMGR